MLTRTLIENMYSKPVYREAEKLIQQGKVHDLNRATMDGVWTALVLANAFYRIRVKVDGNDQVDGECPCVGHREKGECPHVAAVLMAISDRTIPRKSAIEDQVSNSFTSWLDSYHETGRRPKVSEGKRLIQSFKKLTHHQHLPDLRPESVTKVPLKTEVKVVLEPEQLGFSHVFTVEMRAGEKRLYVVKNLSSFLEGISKGEEVQVSQRFIYDPERHRFTEADRKLLDQLLRIEEIERFYDMSGVYTHSRKQLLIPTAELDKVLEPLMELGAFVYHGDGTYLGPLQLEKNTPFTFAVQRVKGELKVQCNRVMEASSLTEYGYVSLDGKLYAMTDQQLDILNELQRVLPDKEISITIDRHEEEALFSEVVPKLELLGPVNVSDDALKYVDYKPLEAELYMDLTDQGRLTAKVVYRYGDVLINPMIQKDEPVSKKGKALVRDRVKEDRIMHVIEQMEFHYNGRELYLDDEEMQYQFLFDYVPVLQEEAAIYLSGSLKSMMDQPSYTPQFHLELNEGSNFLDVGFELSGVSQEELAKILEAVVEKKRYYRMPSGAFIPLDEETFSPVRDVMTELNLSPGDMEDGKLQLPAWRSLEAEEVIRSEGKVRYSRAIRELLEAVRHPENGDDPLPEGLNATMRDYQLTGYQWLRSLSRYGFGGILADDMGLGKTIQAISFLLSLKEERGTMPPALVVAPASLLHNWKNEIHQFAPGLTVHVLDGHKEDRIQQVEDQMDKADVLITSYPKLRQDIKELKTHPFSTFILDEAQAVKNTATKVAKAVKEIRAERRFALSGTPVENSLDELWAIFDAVMPGLFPAKRGFKQMDADQVARISRPFILRRLKKDVLKELPDKIETVQHTVLTDDQKALYLGYLERIQGEAFQAIATEGFQQSRMKILAGLTRLRQLCCHPSLFVDSYEGESGKLNALVELVATAVASGRRLLIFSQFSSMLKIIQETLKKEGYDLFYLDGQTPGQERVEMAQRFNDGEKEIFLISLKAGGTGLNLPGADLVVLFDLWWNPAVEEQAAGRAHRIGQKNVVQVVRMVTEGTIEEKIHALQQRKKELIDTVIQPGESSISALTEDDIRELLTF